MYYVENIKHRIILPIVEDWDAHVFHLFPIRSKRRDELQEYLRKNGVQTLIHYPIPPHKQLCYPKYNNLNLPITEMIHREELSLPMSQVLEVDEIVRITDLMNNF